MHSLQPAASVQHYKYYVNYPTVQSYLFHSISSHLDNIAKGSCLKCTSRALISGRDLYILYRNFHSRVYHLRSTFPSCALYLYLYVVIRCFYPTLKHISYFHCSCVVTLIHSLKKDIRHTTSISLIRRVW